MQRHLMYPALLAILVLHKTPDPEFPLDQHRISTAMIDPVDRIPLTGATPHVNTVRPHGGIAGQWQLCLRTDIVGNRRRSWLRRRSRRSDLMRGSAPMVDTPMRFCRMGWLMHGGVVLFMPLTMMMGSMRHSLLSLRPTGGTSCKQGHHHNR